MGCMISTLRNLWKMRSTSLLVHRDRAQVPLLIILVRTGSDRRDWTLFSHCIHNACKLARSNFITHHHSHSSGDGNIFDRAPYAFVHELDRGL